MNLTITLNGSERELTIQPGDTLLKVLRREGLFSVRFGSHTGEAGAAAVLVDGELVSADILLAAQVDGKTVETVESLSQGTNLHPIQEAFIRTGAIQSGYSTPAMILAAKALLERNPNPSETEVRDAFSGILDRETGYVKPVQAVLEAAAVLRGEPPTTVEPLVLTPVNLIEQDFLDFFRGAREGDGDGWSTPEQDGPEVQTRTVRPPKFIVSPSVPEMQVVGKSEPKVDALKLVKGNPAFTDDFEMRGMLYAKLLTSPHAHARILDIDDSEARALPGVHAVVTYEDVSDARIDADLAPLDRHLRFVGDEVAVVAAESEALAEDALRLIDVEYEVLPAVFDADEALQLTSPLVHENGNIVGGAQSALALCGMGGGGGCAGGARGARRFWRRPQPARRRVAGGHARPRSARRSCANGST